VGGERQPTLRRVLTDLSPAYCFISFYCWMRTLACILRMAHGVVVVVVVVGGRYSVMFTGAAAIAKPPPLWSYVLSVCVCPQLGHTHPKKVALPNKSQD